MDDSMNRSHRRVKRIVQIEVRRIGELSTSSCVAWLTVVDHLLSNRIIKKQGRRRMRREADLMILELFPKAARSGRSSVVRLVGIIITVTVVFFRSSLTQLLALFVRYQHYLLLILILVAAHFTIFFLFCYACC